MDENILFKSFYSAFLSTGLFSIACLTIIIALCEVKKKKLQVQHPAAFKKTSVNPSACGKNEIEECQKPTTTAASTEDDEKTNKNQGVEEGLQRQSSSKESDENNNILNKKKKEKELDAKDCKAAEQDVGKKKFDESHEIPPPKDKAQVLGKVDDIVKGANPEEGQQQEKDKKKKKKKVSKYRQHRKRRELGDQVLDQPHHRRRPKYWLYDEEDTLCEVGREMPCADYSEEFYESRKKSTESK